MNWLGMFAPGADAPRLADAKEIDRLYKRHRWVTMATLVGAYAFFYTCRLSLSVVKKPLETLGIFSTEEMGWIGLATFWAYAAGKLINGFLADRANVRVFLAVGLATSAVLNIAMGMNETAILAVILWGLNGWFQGMGNPGCVVSMTQWFGRGERGSMYGVWSSAQAIGEGLTQIGTAVLVSYTVWRAAFIGPGVLCIGVSVLVYVLLRDRPTTLGLPPIDQWKSDTNEERDDNAPPPEAVRTSFATQLSLLRLPAIWIIGLSAACMYVTRIGINSWGIYYIETVHGVSTAVAGTLVGVNTFTGIAGSIAYGYLSDRFFSSRRPPLTLIFGLLEIGSLFLIFFAPGNSLLWVSGGFLLYGFALNGILAVLGGLFALDVAPPGTAGAAMGIVGVFSYVGGGLQEVISGTLIARGTTVIDGVKHYDFGAPIAFWIGASVISMILAASLWRVKAR